MKHFVFVVLVLFIIEIKTYSIEYKIQKEVQNETNTTISNKTGRLVRNWRTNARNKTWPRGIVYYYFDNNYPKDARKNIAHPAMKAIEQATCVRFQMSDPNEQDKILRIHSTKDRCASSVGMVDGTIASNLHHKKCKKEIAIHEFIHVLGFYHEHTRADRDSRVKVLFKNILKGSDHNFKKITANTRDLGLPYDYHSIMHYRTNSLGQKKKSTLQPSYKGAETLMGQRIMMTALDIAKINRLYDCRNHYQGDDMYIHQ